MQAHASRKAVVVVIAGVLCAVAGAQDEQSRAAGGGFHQIRRHLGRTARSSSFALIREALVRGQISAETALLYRVFAAFGDERLPAAFHGDDSALVESPVDLAAVQAALPTLSAETQAALRPFLVPPIYEGSWMARGTSAPIAGTLDAPPLCGKQVTGWEWVQTSNGKVRIWWFGLQPDAGQADAAHATEMASWVDNDIWPNLVGIMQEGHQPVSDLSQGPCNGGDGLLDVYLTSASFCSTKPYLTCGPSPVYVVAARNIGPQTLAHEIMHAFQYSYKLAGGCLSEDEKYKWWGEATAQWAMDYVYPSRQGEQDAAPALLKYSEVALNTVNDYHEYGAYLLPFYIHRSTGNPFTIGLSWAKCEASDVPDALHAIDAVVDGGFDKLWPEFVLHNWNRAPVDDYQRWDVLAHQAATYDGSVYNPPQVAPDVDLAFPVDLPRLSATYAHYKFTTDDARSVAFWNGATFKLDRRDQGHMLGVEFVTDPLPDAEKKGGFVRALVKIEGKPWSIENWTERPFVSFCRDLADERLEELVLIVSNSDFKDYDRRLKAQALSPRVWVSNMGCWQWKGKITFTMTGQAPCPGLCNYKYTLATQVTFTRRPTMQFPPMVDYQLTTGAEALTVTGDCTGATTFPTFGNAAILQTFNFIPSEGELHRTYIGGGATTADHPLRQVDITCPGFTGAVPEMPWWMFPPRPIPGMDVPLARLVRVSADGTKLVDSFKPSENGVWEWNLNAERQP